MKEITKSSAKLSSWVPLFWLVNFYTLFVAKLPIKLIALYIFYLQYVESGPWNTTNKEQKCPGHPMFIRRGSSTSVLACFLRPW